MSVTVKGMATDLEKPPLRVLLMDGIRDRANHFHVRGTDYVLVSCDSIADLGFQLLNNGPWDILFLAAHFGTGYADPLAPIPSVLAAHREQRLKGVVLMTPSLDDGKRQRASLKLNGVPVFYYPYNYNNPSLHTEFTPEERKPEETAVVKYFGPEI